MATGIHAPKNMPRNNPYDKLGQSSIEMMLRELLAHKSKMEPFHFFEEESPFLRGYRLQRGYLHREQNEDRSVKYHEGDVYPGIGRSTHNQSRLGYSYLALRIRTTDDASDLSLITGLRKCGIDVETQELSDRGYGTVSVALKGDEDGRYYEISAQGVSKYDIDEAKETMDRVGKVFLQAKELVQKKGRDSEELAKELRSSPPNLPVMLYGYSDSNEVAEAIRGLAAAYVSQPGILNRPLISLFEAGELADSALGAEQVHGELRECVRRQVGWVFQGGNLTAMDFSRIFHRICDAMGIPPITD